MTTKSIYLKYREERDYAKYLKEFKKNKCQMKKVATVRLERLDLKALMKKKEKEKKQSVPVSLPIKYFNNILSKKMSNDQGGQKELKTPNDKIERTVRQDVGPNAPARMVRHQVVAAPHDNRDGDTIKSLPINLTLLPVNLTVPATRKVENKSKKVETYTPMNLQVAAKTNVIPVQGNDQISVKLTPIKENYGIAHRKVDSNEDIIDSASKTNIMPFQEDDHINKNYPNYRQKIDTAEKENVGIAQRILSFTSSKEVGTNTSTDNIDTGEMSNVNISIKHKLPVPVAPTMENYGKANRKVSYINAKHVGTNTPTNIKAAAIANERTARTVSSANEVKRCLKALVITSTQTDKIPIVNENELQILGIVTKSGVTNDELVDALESFKKEKELGKFNVTEVIDLVEPTPDKDSPVFKLATYHSAKNKKAIFENYCVRTSNSTSTKSAPTPIDLEKQEILEMRYKLIESMNYEQLKAMLDSQDQTNNKENSNKKRKTTESGDNYDEANMEMEINIPGAQSIMNQPVTATPLPKPTMHKSTTQQRLMQPIKAQKQNNESRMPELHLSTRQPLIRQESHLECLQRQRMQQEQFLQELKQNNKRGRAKPPQQEQTPQFKNPQTQLYSKSQQFQQPLSKSPQIQQPYSMSPHNQQPQSQPTVLQEQLQQQLDRRIPIRDQQRAALPQQHYQYESASNGYQTPVFSQVPQNINSTQQPQFQIYPGDPRIQAYQSQMSQVMPSATRMMSTYEANLQTSGSSHSYQNNGYNNQLYW